MIELKYKVGDCVVLNGTFEYTYGFNDMYCNGSILQITQVVVSDGLIYQAEIPKFLGDFDFVFISDDFIDHEATAKLNKDKL